MGIDARLDRLSLQVSSAKISTYGEKVVDVFYVKNLFGHKVEQEDRIAEIRAALTEVLAKGNQPPNLAPTRRTREIAAAK
jgi:[protein-PII] uridylyltransferase